MRVHSAILVALFSLSLLSSKPVRRKPAPKTPAVPARNACKTSADCVVFCPQAAGCCPSAPCGCMQAINRSFISEANQEYAKSCTRAPKCEAMGCAYQQEVMAVCRENRCVASRTPAF